MARRRIGKFRTKHQGTLIYEPELLILSDVKVGDEREIVAMCGLFPFVDVAQNRLAPLYDVKVSKNGRLFIRGELKKADA